MVICPLPSASCKNKTTSDTEMMHLKQGPVHGAIYISNSFQVELRLRAEHWNMDLLSGSIADRWCVWNMDLRLRAEHWNMDLLSGSIADRWCVWNMDLWSRSSSRQIMCLKQWHQASQNDIKLPIMTSSFPQWHQASHSGPSCSCKHSSAAQPEQSRAQSQPLL